MPLLEELTKSDLRKILQLKSWEEIENLPFMLSQLEELEELAQHDENLENNKTSQSLIEALTDGPIYPFYVLWTLIGLIKLGILTLGVLTAGFSMLTLVAGGMFYYLSYRTLNEQADVAHQFFKLNTLKEKVADELINKYTTDLGKKNISIPSNPFIKHEDEADEDAEEENIQRVSNRPEPTNQFRLPDIRQSLGAGLLTFATVFGTYFLGANAIIAAFKLSIIATAMLGPVGLFAAVGMSALLAVYLGYQHYQAYANTEKLNANRAELEDRLDQKIIHANKLQKLDRQSVLPNFIRKATKASDEEISVTPKSRVRTSAFKFARGQMIMFNMKRIMSKNTGPFIPVNNSPTP